LGGFSYFHRHAKRFVAGRGDGKIILHGCDVKEKGAGISREKERGRIAVTKNGSRPIWDNS